MTIKRRDALKRILRIGAGLMCLPNLDESQARGLTEKADEQTTSPQHRKNLVKGIYVSGWYGVSKKSIRGRMSLLEDLGFNTLMIDVKNAHGELFYQSQNKLAQEIGAQVKTKEGHTRELNIEHLVQEATRRNIRLIARHVVFRDKQLYEQQSQLRLFRENNEFWVDPRNEQVKEYNLELLAEESAMGFDEIVLDYIRFPATKMFGTQKEKNDVITNFVKASRKVVKGTDLSVQIFGYAAWDYWRAGVGQDIKALDEHVDIIYPMIYPNHFHRGSFGYTNPAQHPYEFILMGCQAAMNNVSHAKIMPMLQAFSCTAHDVKEQVRAANDARVPGFIFWNPSGRYKQVAEAKSSTNNDVVLEQH